MSQEPSLSIWNRVPWILCGLGHTDSFFDPTISCLVRRVLFCTSWIFHHFYLKLTDNFATSRRVHVIGGKFNRKE